MKEKIKKYLEKIMKAFNFNKIMANSPKVIGSCNAIAKQYLKIKHENSDKNEKEIYTELINWLPSSDINHQALLSILNHGEINNLALLIFWSYVFNTDLKYCSSDFKQEILKTIQKELKKYNLE